MKKKGLAFCCVTVLMLCQCFVPSAGAITDEQSAAIKDHCETIRENLKRVQKEDSRVRVYLGGYYETILSKFIVPLNVRLVENNLSSAGLVENQNKFAAVKADFADDFVKYQKELEELVGMDCKEKPADFYDKLTAVRQRRQVMVKDVQRMRSLISGHVQLVESLKGEL